MGIKRLIFCVFALCIGCPVAADVPSTSPAAQSLDGVWLVETCSPWQTVINRSTLTVSGNHFAFRGFRNIDQDWTGTISFATDGNAQHFDLQTDSFSLAKSGSSFVYPACKQLPGIFQLDGDHLRIAFAHKDQGTRPKDFEASALNNVATFVRADSGFKTFPASVIITVLDPAGHPCGGASLFGDMSFNYPSKLGKDGKWSIDPTLPMAWQYDDRGKTSADGTIRLNYDEFCGKRTVPVGARDADRGWVGLANVSPASLCHGALTIKMQPRRRIRGTMLREGLWVGNEAWGAAYLTAFGDRFAFCAAPKGEFEFLVPPGSYSLYAYGTGVLGLTQQIVVPQGEGEITLAPISLKSARLITLIGKPAPELVAVRAWKNGPAVRLADLRGKVVLMNFWGYWCGPCVAEMPTLIHLHEKYKDKGLVILGVHLDAGDDVDTAEKLDAKLSKFREGIWKGKDIPFPVGLCCRGNNDAVSAASTYGVQMCPTTIVIDRKGNVLGTTNGKLAIDFNDQSAADAAIEKLLGQ